MNLKSTIYAVLLIGLLLTIFFSCKKKDAIKTLPVVTITSVANITANTASSGGDITNDGGATVTARGVCWSINQNPTTSDHKTSNGTGIGSFTSSVTELTPGTTYYLMAYATNSEGTAYSSQSTFTTLALAPVLTTTEISAVTSTSANSGGNISNDGGSPITARGVCWSANQNPTIASSKTSDGTGTGSFTSSITGLAPGTIYYFRAYATNSIGTAYGNQLTVTATAILATITTTAVSALTSTTATSGGNITNDGGSAVSARGVCWSTSQNPTIDNSKSTDGTGTGKFTSSITGLMAGSNYYIRAFATNSAGTAYGNEVNLIATSGGADGTVTDIDGNVYHTVKIGTQVWMVENLKTTRYNDGTEITINNYWGNLTTGAYCNYDNIEGNVATYGRLYNWYAVNTGKLAPSGWHVPTYDDWINISDGTGTDAKSLCASTNWALSSVAGTPGAAPENNNSSGFSALPGGYRWDNYFQNIGTECRWWDSTKSNGEQASGRTLNYKVASLMYSSCPKKLSLSVRCVKD